MKIGKEVQRGSDLTSSREIRPPRKINDYFSDCLHSHHSQNSQTSNSAKSKQKKIEFDNNKNKSYKLGNFLFSGASHEFTLWFQTGKKRKIQGEVEEF